MAGMNRTGILLLGLLIWNGCSQEDKLCGKWQVAEAYEDGVSMGLDVSPISFQFFPNGYYNFNSVLNYKEAGTYSLRGNMLYSIDTLNKASSEKAVKILKLTQDSFAIQMNAEGKERILRLFKVK
jgi:hypothetical protein